MDGRPTRRQFVRGASVAGLGLLAGCGRWPGQAQAPTNVPRLGFLSGGFAGNDASGVEAFRRGLEEHGWIEGRNLVIEWRYAEERYDQLAILAAELVALPVDLVLAVTTLPAAAAREATGSIPIVMAAGADPVGQGLVESLARPGGNVTGLSVMTAPLTAKRLELLKEISPGISRVALLSTAVRDTPGGERGLRNADLVFAEAQAASLRLGVQLMPVEFRGAEDLEHAFDKMSSDGVDALLTVTTAGTARHRARIAELATERRLPAVYAGRPAVEAGGLMSYGPRTWALYHRAAYYVDRILKGATPADLPVEQPMVFDFVMNLRAAQALGLTIPHHVLLQATEVIQ
jgi:putative tryptophan/tyrosine transport system substrate-binding protein